jgi:hypothetical protein
MESMYGNGSGNKSGMNDSIAWTAWEQICELEYLR